MSNKFTEYYREIQQQKKTTVKGLLRNMALTGLSAIGDEKELRKPRVQFLYIHHIFKDEEAALDTLMKRLSKDHEFISYTDAVDKILSGKIDKPYITFSSDDGFRNNLNAAEILNRYDAKACFFINPGITGEQDYNKIKQHCEQTLKFPTVEFLSWDEVATLQKMGHEIGSHTMMHMNMAEHTAVELNADLQQTMRILTERCGSTPHFAFPYGRFFHFSSAARRAVFDTGFSTCATAERGCHIADGKPMTHTELSIRRDHIVLAWPLSHIMYFLINNAKKATVNNNFFPATLQ